MNKMRWKLNNLYESFEDNNFEKDMNKMDQMIKKINNWVKEELENVEKPVKIVEKYINLNLEYQKLVSKLFSFCSLSLSVEVNNSKAQNFMEKLRKKQVNLKKSRVKFKKWLNELDNFDDIISKSKILKKHEFFLKEMRKDARYLLDEKEEFIIAKMKNNGSTAWSNLQGKLTSNLLVEIELDGEKKKLPLPVVRNMYDNEDQEKRIKAYNAELNAYDKIEQSSASALNSIKGESLTVTELKGYDSILEKTLIQSRLEKETLDTMMETIKEYLPYFEKFYQKKAEILGHENGLPFYDIFAPIKGFSKEYSYDDAREFIVDKFANFSDELADFADNAFENRWIDAEPREGKRGGAFCSNIHSIGESRILANFNGSFGNVKTLSHELGHGYHGYCLKDVSILNSHYPMPVAETASIFCETIVMDAMLEKANEKEKRSLLEKRLTNNGQIIVDIYSRFLFESELFKRRKNEFLSPEDLKEMMLKAQKKAYGNGLDHDYLHPYMWINKPHYYRSGLHYYNFPYAFGLLFTKGLYAEYLKRKDDFVNDYKKLLRATGKNNVEDVANLIGLDVQKKEFWRNSLDLIKNDIEKFIKL